ncbi:hypothetical protein FRC07_008640 [Ceratobasidium sp. 392]|nr:hypothetical protein FRC07_008640 [Ceratobasidium sp. 392]
MSTDCGTSSDSLPLPPALVAFLDRLDGECASSVSDFSARFWQLSPPAVAPSFSSESPTLFTTPDLRDFDASYNLWTLLPVPSLTQLASLRESREAAWLGFDVTSIRVPPSPGIDTDLFLPIWMLDCWVRFHTLLTYAQPWSQSKEWLQSLVRDETFVTRAQECLVRLAHTPLHAPISNIPGLFTSELTPFLGRTWLSDIQMNAGADFINLHHACPSDTRVLNTHFVGSLALHRLRSLTWSPSRPRTIDAMVSSGQLTTVYVPVHEGSHWTLLRVNIEVGTYEYADTMAPRAVLAPNSCIEALSWWLSSVLGRSMTLQPVARRFAVDHQRDSHSCGVAVLTNIAHLVLGELLNQSTVQPVQPADKDSVFDLDLDDLVHPDFGCSDNTSQGTTPEPHTSSSDTMSLPSSPLAAALPDYESDESDHGTYSTESSDLEMKPADSSKPHLPAPPSRLVQTRLPFRRISPAAYATQERARLANFREECRAEREREALEASRAKLARTTYERDRKRIQRTARRLAQVKMGLRGADGKLKKSFLGPSLSPKPSGMSSSSSSPAIAQTSRPRRAFKNRTHVLPNPSKPTTVPSRVNWVHPLLWSQINSTAHAVGTPYSPIEIVRRLQQHDLTTFASLRPQRISQWRDSSFPNELRWKESTLRAVERGNSAPTTSSSCSVLSHFTNLRNAGVPLHLPAIRSYMAAVIQHEAPEIFRQKNKKGRAYCLSNSTVRRFLCNQLGWSFRRATRAAQKTPSNAPTLLRQSFLRLACLIRDEDIPACCIVNADQTQVVYSAGTDSTWNERGQRQVGVLGADEKRAFTLVAGISMSGSAIPPQVIYAGKTARCTPDPSSSGFARAQESGICFIPSGTTSYWSSFATMQLYVTDHLVPYFLDQIRMNNLPTNQRCVFQIDCWSVHRSAQFRNWMTANYPWIVLQYVPGGCTGLFQACDVGIQRLLKLAIQQACHEDIIQETLDLLEAGADPSEIANDTTLKTLRNRSVRWVLEGYNSINNSDLVKKAFELCSVPNTDFNLSYESLTSREARAAILELRSTDPTFYAEITSGAPVTVSEAQAQMEDLAAEAPASDEDDPAVLTVPNLRAALLNANSTSDILPIATSDDSDDEADSDDEYKADSGNEYEAVSPLLPPVTTPAPSTQSMVGPRRSARLSVRHAAY